MTGPFITFMACQQCKVGSGRSILTRPLSSSPRALLLFLSACTCSPVIGPLAPLAPLQAGIRQQGGGLQAWAQGIPCLRLVLVLPVDLDMSCALRLSLTPGTGSENNGPIIMNYLLSIIDQKLPNSVVLS